MTDTIPPRDTRPSREAEIRKLHGSGSLGPCETCDLLDLLDAERAVSDRLAGLLDMNVDHVTTDIEAALLAHAAIVAGRAR